MIWKFLYIILVKILFCEPKNVRQKFYLYNIKTLYCDRYFICNTLISLKKTVHFNFFSSDFWMTRAYIRVIEFQWLLVVTKWRWDCEYSKIWQMKWYLLTSLMLILSSSSRTPSGELPSAPSAEIKNDNNNVQQIQPLASDPLKTCSITKLYKNT